MSEVRAGLASNRRLHDLVDVTSRFAVLRLVDMGEDWLVAGTQKVQAVWMLSILPISPLSSPGLLRRAFGAVIGGLPDLG
jgi:hypothetical protein